MIVIVNDLPGQKGGCTLGCSRLCGQPATILRVRDWAVSAWNVVIRQDIVKLSDSHLRGTLKVLAYLADAPLDEVEKTEIVGAVPVLPGKAELRGHGRCPSLVRRVSQPAEGSQVIQEGQRSELISKASM